MRITPYSGATHNGSGNSLLFLTSLHSQLYLKEKCEGAAKQFLVYVAVETILNLKE